MRNIVILNSLHFSYPLPILMRVSYNTLIVKQNTSDYYKYTEKRMKVTRLMPLIYPFICYFVQKRLSGGKSYFVEKRLSVGKLPFRGKTTTPTPSAPEAAGVLNFLCALRPNTPPPNIP